MNKETHYIFSKNDLIANQYQVSFPLKKGYYAESYRVTDNNGENLFLKLIDPSKLHSTQLTRDGQLTEIQYVKQLDNPHVVNYKDHGEVIVGNRKYIYLLMNFISGETIAEKLQREAHFVEYKAKEIVAGVLKGLSFLHNLSEPIIHNDINHHNVMLDLSEHPPRPKIIDFGYARSFYQSTSIYNSFELNPFYIATECFNHLYSPQSDIFSAGALLYHMLTGTPPWFTEISPYRTPEEVRKEILKARQRPLKLPVGIINDISISERLFEIINKALAPDLDDRFQSAEEFLSTLESNGKVDINTSTNKQSKGTGKQTNNVPEIIDEGRGFDDVAGLDELKETLKNDVIDALLEPEKYREFGLTIPNGLLLYGPPGCGKTFIAEKLSEEISFNYLFTNPSDLGSKFIHGSQEKISALFKEAKENAPTIIFFDELDAMMPERDDLTHHGYTSSVNEFLAQMTNCSKHGIMVIGATNRPQKIDKAILRTGRMDKIVYVPPPDKKAREKIFEIELSNRPVDLGIDYDKLAVSTTGFVASDIVFVVDEAARYALRNDSKIEQNVLEDIISNTRPSLNEEQLLHYESIKDKLEGTTKSDGRKIGF